MNILFLTLVNIVDLNQPGLYQDLLREFSKHGHNVYVATASEKRNGIETHLEKQECGSVLFVKTGNIQKTNLIEKGIATVLLENQYISAIKEYLSNVKFDLVIYTTPPVTLAKAIEYVKKRDNAKTYLLLKDIFPQNSIDLGMLKRAGLKGLIYKYFRKKEQKLYKLSDRIGCMSPANVKYLLEQDLWINQNIVEVCPNSEEPRSIDLTVEEINGFKEKYNIPKDKTIFIYGGNLGKPQCVPHIVNCIKQCEKDIKDAFFVIVGSGTDRQYIDNYIKEEHPDNLLLLDYLPKVDYEKVTAACDVGLIFLDYHFNIPNFPSRLLTYMQAGIPVICCTDPNTDIGTICEEGQFGWKCMSDDVHAFEVRVKLACDAERKAMGINARKYFLENYTAEKSYQIIMKGIDNK